MKWLRRLRADYLLARNRTAEAASIYRDLLRSEPAHVPGLLAVLADCHERGAVDEAIEVATRALEVDSGHFMALRILGWAYVTRGDHASARPLIARALEQFDAQQLGEPSRALRAIDRVFASGPGVSEPSADSLNAWRRWAEEYVGSRV